MKFSANYKYIHTKNTNNSLFINTHSVFTDIFIYAKTHMCMCLLSVKEKHYSIIILKLLLTKFLFNFKAIHTVNIFYKEFQDT